MPYKTGYVKLPREYITNLSGKQVERGFMDLPLFLAVQPKSLGKEDSSKRFDFQKLDLSKEEDRVEFSN